MQEREFLRNIGKRIAKYRNARKMTQTQLGDLCDMERPSIGRLEAGKSNATSLTLLKISHALNIHIKKIFDFEYED